VSFLDSLGSPLHLLGEVKVTLTLRDSLLPDNYTAADVGLYVASDTGTLLRINNVTKSGSLFSFRTSVLTRFFMAVDILSPLVKMLGNDTLLEEGEDAQIIYSSSDNILNPQMSLRWRLAGDTVTHRRALDASELNGIATIPASVLSNLGVLAWVEGDDGVHQTLSDGVNLRVQLGSIAMPVAMPEERYDMFSFPYMDGSLSVLAGLESQLGPYNPKTWRCYLLDSASFVEVDAEHNPKASPGRAYWLRTRDMDPLFQLENVRTYAVAQMQQVHLQPGWNAISTPYAFDIDWRSVRVATGSDTAKIMGIYAFNPEDKSWSLPDMTRRMKAWSGVLVKNLEDTVVTLQMPSLTWDHAATLAKASNAINTSSQRWAIIARQQGLSSGMAWAGRSLSARTEYDAQDYLLPPVPGSRMAVYFSHRNWGKWAGAYAVDERPASDSVTRWDFTVQGFASNAVLRLGLSGVTSTDTARLWLLDSKSGRVIEWTDTIEVATGNESSRDFSLVLAKSMPQERVVTKVSTALGPELKVQNGRLSWIIPESVGRGYVNLRVVAVDGRTFRTIVHELQDPGVYEMALPKDLPHGPGYRMVLSINGYKESQMLR